MHDLGKKDRAKRIVKRIEVSKAFKRMYYLTLILLLPVSFASFSISFTNLIEDPWLSTIAFITGFVTFTIFVFIAAMSSISMYYGGVIDTLRKEIADMQENAAITLSSATSQLNEIVMKMADGTIVQRPETEFNVADPNPEPLVSVRQLSAYKKEKENE